jgi:hypothetical protein
MGGKWMRELCRSFLQKDPLLFQLEAKQEILEIGNEPQEITVCSITAQIHLMGKPFGFGVSIYV